MTTRNNTDRIGAAQAADPPPIPTIRKDEETPFHFATPTEFVDLPSGGRYYPEGHPLHNVGTLEIRYMTAKDEDILSSRTLIKKGLAIDRFLANVIINKKVTPEMLLIGDKNAVLVAARITGYGANYETKVTCPVCATHSDFSFDLNEAVVKDGTDHGPFKVEEVGNGKFAIPLPKSGVRVETRLMAGSDERKLLALSEQRKRKKAEEALLTDQLRLIILSVDGTEDRQVINNFISNMPAMDSRYIRDAMSHVTPNVDLTQDFSCTSCGYEQEMEVPFTTDFFWPRR
tara:strand:+ start:56 stop:916 length:861 start_codon:yes stop_codon:yes gene_type:complete